MWVNSPGNPDGRVLDAAALRAAVARARELGAVLASDECYAELGWDAPWDARADPSVLDPRVTDGDLRGILSVYSLSKQSNLAGYRAAFLAGDPTIVGGCSTARKHLGLMLPAPVQAAMVAALGDDAHVAAQKERYRARRALLKPALEAAGFRIDASEAGLYLWATEGRDAWESIGAARRPRHPRRSGPLLRDALPAARPPVADRDRRADRRRRPRRLRAASVRIPPSDAAAFGRVSSRRAAH